MLAILIVATEPEAARRRCFLPSLAWVDALKGVECGAPLLEDILELKGGIRDLVELKRPSSWEKSVIKCERMLQHWGDKAVD